MTSIVVLCGSTRFRAEITTANRDLTLAGSIVLAPGVFQHDGDTLTEAQKAGLDVLHLRKIDLADSVFVVNPGQYIGSSTRNEIGYAEATGKPVRYLVDPLPCRACPPDCGTCNGGHCECYEHQNNHPMVVAARMAEQIHPQPGDIWHDVCPSFTGGQLWHARADGNGRVELYEPNGPGLVHADAVTQMRGGMTLVERNGVPVTAAVAS